MTNSTIKHFRRTLVNMQSTELLGRETDNTKRLDDFYKAIETAKEALDAILNNWDLCINCKTNPIDHKESGFCSECLDELQLIPSDSDLLGW